MVFFTNFDENSIAKMIKMNMTRTLQQFWIWFIYIRELDYEIIVFR
jgi:hypothetical protein